MIYPTSICAIADERDQRGRRHADPQPSRSAVRRRTRYFRRSDGYSAQVRRAEEPADQSGLLRLRTIACGRISKIYEKHFSIQNKPQYWHASGGLEYEAAWALGSNTGIDDLEALTMVKFVCNEQGLDPISFGATVSAAMELYDLGLITKETTGGIELKFGSAEAQVKCVELTGKAEGFGKELGLGSLRLCQKYGRPDLSMSVNRTDPHGLPIRTYGRFGSQRANTGWGGDDYYSTAVIHPNGDHWVLCTPGSNVLPAFDADGLPLSSFGTNCVVEFPSSPYPSYRHFGVQPDGKIVLGGRQGPGNALLITRLLPNGTTDAQFGSNGHLVLSNMREAWDSR